MASSSRCTFCDKLPACGPTGSGTQSKCPLCKGDLLNGSNATYRLLSAEEALAVGLPGRSRRGRAFLLCSCAAGIMLAIGLTMILLNGRPDHDPAPGVAKDSPTSVPVARLHRVPERQPAKAATEPKPVEPAPVPVAPVEVTAAPTVPASPVVRETEPFPAAAVQRVPEAPPWAHRDRSEEVLRRLLRDKITEIGIEDPAKPAPKDAKEARVHLTKLAKALAEENKKNIDGVVAHLRGQRPDLAGLPYRMGKDCELPSKSASILAEVSQAVRTLKNPRPSRTSSEPNYPESVKVHLFWSQMQALRHKQLDTTTAVNTLQQMLQIESPLHRRSMIEFLDENENNPTASGVLAQRAVFDLDAGVRQRAVEVLMRRNHKEYIDVLLAALRHPWLPAAEHAAETLVALDVKEAVPHLVRFLGEPDPAAPLEKDGQTAVVREVVRVNHLRNCLLCHAASSGTRERAREFVVAPVPVPGEELPPSVVYYAERSGFASVRADVTYLKQDFSVMQPVKDAGKWPAEQRFDYLVRERPLTLAERLRFRSGKYMVGPQPLSDHQQALLYALRSLTGRDVGVSARAWEEVLCAQRHEATLSAQLSERDWRRKCEK